MKRINLLLLLCILYSFAAAQTGTIVIKKPKKQLPATKAPVPPEIMLRNPGLQPPPQPSMSSLFELFDLYYGNKLFFKNFSGQFSTTGQFKIGKPVQVIAFGPSGHFPSSRSKYFYGHILFNSVLPQKVQLNDSINCRINGFVFSVAWGLGLATADKKFITMAYIGFNTGRIRFSGNELVRQKNPYISPKIGIQPKLVLNKFSITFIAEAEYDISKTNWRRLNIATGEKTALAPFRQSGITAMIGVSYRLAKLRQRLSE